MVKTKANGIELEYETFGDSSDKALLLVNGLGSQMIDWYLGFVLNLVGRGFYVIRFDNRDVGLSSKMEEPDRAQYSLEDMADDAVGLLDALNIAKAHICGESMGGMIVQIIALRYPTRVLSLTSIMSSTGNPNIPRGDPEVGKVLMQPAPSDREGYVEYYVKLRRLLYGSFPYDEDKNREISGRFYDRSFYPPGISRQSMAIMRSGNRKSHLSSIKVPTLIIHGTDDPVIPVEGGKDTHEAIPGSKLLIIEGMGHSFPQETWRQISAAIAENASKA
ncbi:MAG: alpha/beta fold hydrolase [Promethearchaeota archaeon]|jgi:pimeloyl-ACP methyl ester carboxylesterase